MYWVIDKVLSCMQNQFLHLAKKYDYNYSKKKKKKNPSLLFTMYFTISIALSHKGGTFIIEAVGLLLFFMQPLYHYFNRLPARKWGLVQKDLESTLVVS